MAEIIDGKRIAAEVRGEVRRDAEAFFAQNGIKPCLAVVMVGNDPASAIYVRNKQKACRNVGIESVSVLLDEDSTTQEVLAEVEKLNNDKSVNGILVQLPLPSRIDAEQVVRSVSPTKDVDGFSAVNAGEMFRDRAPLEPCTPRGCIELLKRYEIPIQGANAVIVGRSNLVGKPLAVMLTRENATVTLCHSKTKDLGAYLSNADIVVAAVGKPGIIKGEMLKKGCCVIDVGINRLDDGRIVGDVDFESASEAAAYITPVPGGVGPMTIAMLLKNTMAAAGSQYA
ncbi:MAG: bifunctional methylenetetrahydrofolate dehydrogenase/methenyltetrahydrofolate cyclohydrolase FolD [Clostridiales bacterium]|nr:bifunctional methylenetetrahydrofolate dehydrogenase/methenyltetrahydrofolate cyclohydrolase FolD [Clostridiales bacterium]